MLKNILKSAIIILVCNGLAYTPLLRAEQLSLPSGDLIAPEITQEVYEDKTAPGSDHEITVQVTDNVAVAEVSLYFRVIGKTEYQRRAMLRVGKTDDFVAKINADEITPPGIEYYVQAKDTAGNTLLHGYSFSPLTVKVDSTGTQPDLAGTTLPSALEPKEDEEKKGISKWVWIGLGAVAVGALALSGSSSGGDAPPPATLNVTATEPSN